MVQKNFGIYSDDLSGSDLVIETGADYIACWCKDKAAATVKAFELFGFAAGYEKPFAQLLAEVQLHSRLLTTHFNTVYCIWGYANGICVPNEYYSRSTAAAAIELMHGTTVDQKSIIENTLGDCVVATAIKEDAWDAYTKHYRVAANMHKYYSLLRIQKPKDEEDKIHIVFYHNDFILSAYKKGQLQIVQRFAYKVPEDALYHILNVCDIYNLNAGEVPVRCSGMIDDSSSLYHTLQAYLGNFTFEVPEKAIFAAESFHEYPLHYFASFCQHDI
ncbi:DUF3822 family protein [Panacibacter sp. DH6]|uniref:DUF3822 family protein n=1 Tax=Panacibacter microcysteis TaxID=2793269 RepID=A0A931E2P5_9BACT|nr:DUF3822 family protein [Panacibacter microcysteis]MBG9376485.1 DUF3822 family protein [Panacibacter microcysteis]